MRLATLTTHRHRTLDRQPQDTPIFLILGITPILSNRRQRASRDMTTAPIQKLKLLQTGYCTPGVVGIFKLFQSLLDAVQRLDTPSSGHHEFLLDSVSTEAYGASASIQAFIACTTASATGTKD